MDELPLLIEACRRLGAPETQADVMARQLLKRADQLSSERGISREASLEYLLKLVISGRNGSVDTSFTGGSKDMLPKPNSSEQA
ncbi:MAG TPA: hypothetical protein VKC60_06200 [Opitutaceae bacterium]|nr:hypothetical protein [Opitutaceae bacterium]